MTEKGGRWAESQRVDMQGKRGQGRDLTLGRQVRGDKLVVIRSEHPPDLHSGAPHHDIPRAEPRLLAVAEEERPGRGAVQPGRVEAVPVLAL